MGFRNEVDQRELSIGSVYKIESLQTVQNAKFGDAKILQMRTIDGAEIAVSATQLLANELKKKKLPCYLRPCGLVRSKIIIIIYNDQLHKSIVLSLSWVLNKFGVELDVSIVTYAPFMGKDIDGDDDDYDEEIVEREDREL